LIPKLFPAGGDLAARGSKINPAYGTMLPGLSAHEF
jgi:hypothetical protein